LAIRDATDTLTKMHAFEPSPVPLVTGDDAVIRISGTRITLDTIVAAFDRGSTAEEIVQQYPTLGLEAAYSALAWILQHREEVDAYLAKRTAESALIRAEIEKRSPPDGIRARLLARQRPSDT
jgi:uncharacterized protein (DUF433 family)